DTIGGLVRTDRSVAHLRNAYGATQRLQAWHSGPVLAYELGVRGSFAIFESRARKVASHNRGNPPCVAPVRYRDREGVACGCRQAELGGGRASRRQRPRSNTVARRARAPEGTPVRPADLDGQRRKGGRCRGDRED